MTTKLFFVRNRLTAQLARRQASSDVSRYLQGKLTVAAAQNVETAIMNDEELAADCQFMALMQEAAKSSVPVFSADGAIERGLARL